jgi:alkylresorcinol/alkylpyrone synthase
MPLVTTSSDPRIAGVGVTFPEQCIEQDQARQAVCAAWDHFGVDYDLEWVDYFFERVGVKTRHLCLEPQAYADIDSFGAANDHYIRVATELGASAVDKALAQAGLPADALDAIFFTTVTGVASPSIDSRVINRLELPRRIRRTPMFGLGCVGGAAGLARMADYLRGHPDHAAVLLSVELCSLTLEREETSIADYIAAALFSDGAAAVVGVGSELATRLEVTGPAMVDSRAAFFHDTEWVMGWNIDESGFGLVLSGDLPGVIDAELATEVDDFLGTHDLTRRDIATWISHPGGPKVLEAIHSALELDDDALALAWRSLEQVGNMSSASVLHVLQQTLAGGLDKGPAVLLAMGPGFAAEFVLLR